MTDHFEPSHADGIVMAEAEIQRQRMVDLLREYPRITEGCRDAAGSPPKRTWFLPPCDHRHGNLRQLVSLCEQGYGEVELHLHHGKSEPDTAENLEHVLRLCVRDYSEFGVFGTEDGEKRYGFIHGDWALANSRRDGRYCGVRNELQLLCDTGCYADFTFPSCNECNPRQINSIYYADNDQGHRLGYDCGTRVEKGRTPSEGLMLIQGPLHPIFLRNSPLSLRAFGDDITGGKPGTPRRVDAWVATWIHVKGKPDWVVVKVHTHGTTDASVVLAEPMRQTFQYLENAYNDGDKFFLHYVSARELYNIVKAAEEGQSGDPESFRDYRIFSSQ
jgi:hypothetical protein